MQFSRENCFTSNLTPVSTAKLYVANLDEYIDKVECLVLLKKVWCFKNVLKK